MPSEVINVIAKKSLGKLIYKNLKRQKILIVLMWIVSKGMSRQRRLWWSKTVCESNCSDPDYTSKGSLIVHCF